MLCKPSERNLCTLWNPNLYPPLLINCISVLCAIAVVLPSGALDVTEEVGAAFGIPHVSQVWEEVHRSHRSHSINKTPIPEEGEFPMTENRQEKESTPLSTSGETVLSACMTMLFSARPL